MLCGGMQHLEWPSKYTNDVLDHTLSWAFWLEEGDVIVSASATVISGDMTVGNCFHTDDRTIVWVSGGTPGTTSVVSVAVFTAEGRTKEEHVEIVCRTA